LYLVFHQKFERSKFLSFIIGIFLIVVFQAQPLWLVGLLPIVAYQYFANRQFQLIPLFCFGMLFAFLTFQYLKSDLSTFWTPKILEISNFSLKSIRMLPGQIYQNFSGSYRFNKFLEPVFITKILAKFSTLFIFAGVSITFLLILLRKKIDPLIYVFCISMMLAVCYPVFMAEKSPRYLLPLTDSTAKRVLDPPQNSKSLI